MQHPEARMAITEDWIWMSVLKDVSTLESTEFTANTVFRMTPFFLPRKRCVNVFTSTTVQSSMKVIPCAVPCLLECTEFATVAGVVYLQSGNEVSCASNSLSCVAFSQHFL